MFSLNYQRAEENIFCVEGTLGLFIYKDILSVSRLDIFWSVQFPQKQTECFPKEWQWNYCPTQKGSEVLKTTCIFLHWIGSLWRSGFSPSLWCFMLRLVAKAPRVQPDSFLKETQTSWSSSPFLTTRQPPQKSSLHTYTHDHYSWMREDKEWPWMTSWAWWLHENTDDALSGSGVASWTIEHFP